MIASPPRLTRRQHEFLLRADKEGIVRYQGGVAWERVTLFGLVNRGLVEFVSTELKDQPEWMGNELKSHDVRITAAGHEALKALKAL
jgi:hypothetical protein